VRFDDRIRTVLALADTHDSMRAAKWRQLVDLLAQQRDPNRGELLARAYAYLREQRGAVPFGVRQQVAAALAGRSVAPDLFAFFTDDHQSVAAPLIAGARLSADDWLAVLPVMSPTARSLLRHRRDLASDVGQALAAFGASDFALPGTVAADAPVIAEPEEQTGAEQGGQIRDLVARIEAFRKHREEHVPPPAERAEEQAIDSFRWESAADGAIIWVEGAPRGPLIGQSIANVGGSYHGVDGQAAGAFEKRAQFRDARLCVGGGGPAAGDWRISGVPFFNSHSGSFVGYRGTARRPRLDEVAGAGRTPAPAPSGVFGPDFPADSLRQLIHELRTPLNAIVGFAEMIDGQIMGPAADAYRARATGIMDQAQRLLGSIDDLDTAARIETHRIAFDDRPVDAVALLVRLHDAYERIAIDRGAHIAIEIARDLPQAKVEASAAERMFSRILAATVGLAGAQETISATMKVEKLGTRPMLCFAIDRPQAIADRGEAALLDPGYSPDGDWPAAPALGLGFSLRLVRNLAEAVGGALTIDEDHFLLYLPPLEQPELSSGQGM
jgi:hypothetical protein